MTTNTAHSSRVEYERRMHKVLAYIDAHLDSTLDLTTLAGVAHFSPFHFHRLFAAWMGETMGDYLRRRRVEVAAMRMAAQPRLSVVNAALDVGFSSGEAFSRAFRLRFGASPTIWRASMKRERAAYGKTSQGNSNLSQAQLGQAVETACLNHTLKDAMQVTLMERQPATVAYLRYVGPPGEPVLQFWQHTYVPWAATHQLLDKPRYGISHDDPSIVQPARLRYDACVEVPADFVPSGNAQVTSLPGGRYAVGRFVVTSAQFPAGWQSILRDWLPGSGLQLDARPSFEFYGSDSTYDPTTGVMACDICIPVAPL